MKGKYLISLLIFLSVLAGLLFGIKLLIPKTTKGKQVIINNRVFEVEIADTPQKRIQGLSGRSAMAKNQGMLFAFEKPDNYTFWMNQMKFSLDFVFTNNNQVVDLAENIPFPEADEQPQAVTAKTYFDKVLEINAGMVKELGIRIDDQVQFP